MTESTSEGARSGVHAAQSEAAEVARTAAGSTRQVAQTAQEQAKRVGAEGAAQARDLLREARSSVGEQAAVQQRNAASALRSLGDELQSMAGHAQTPGLAADAASRGAHHARAAAQWLEDRDPGSALEELRNLGRRRPLLFLAAAAAAGVVAGRLTRAVASGSGEQQGGGALSPSAAAAVADPATSAMDPGASTMGLGASGMGAPAARPYATSDFTAADQRDAGLDAVAAEYPLEAGESPAEGISGARVVPGSETPR